MARTKAVKVSEIRLSMIEQLKSNGADIPVFAELIESYLWLTDFERELRADIRKNGRLITLRSAAGQEYQKENPAIKQLMQTSKQRMSILDKLGVSPAACVDPSDEEL